LNRHSIVGLQWEDGVKTTFYYDDKKLVQIGNDDLELLLCKELELTEYIKRLKNSITEVFIFNNMKDLFKWMSE
jgi:hypothetical protein